MKNQSSQLFILRRLRLFWRRNYAFIIALPLAALLFYYTLHVEPKQLAVTEYTFKHAAITPELDGTVIAFAADIHVNEQRLELWQQAIKCINERNAALVLLGGDFINGNGRGIKIEKLLETFPQIQSSCGIYSIPGNHEMRYKSGGEAAIRNAFHEYKQNYLLDQSVIIKTPGGGKFNLIGLAYYSNPHHRNNPERWKNLFRNDMLNIVLAHTPEDFFYLPEKAHLTMAGHTHGGQIYLPGLGSVLNPSYGRTYSYGKVQKKDQTLLITSGLGSAYTQARFCMKPEIVFVTLKSLHKK